MEFFIKPYEFENFDAFDKHILKHILIEYKEKNNFSKSCVIEAYGVYEGLREFAARLTNDLHQKVKDRLKMNNFNIFEMEWVKEDFKDIPNIFFSNLSIRCKFSKQFKSNYHRVPNKKLTDDWKVDIELYIDPLNRNWPNIVYKKLMHELTHAYDDYNALLKGYKRFDLAYLLLKDIEDFDKDKKILMNSDNKEYFREIFRFILNIERNAYAAELVGELKKLDTGLIYKPEDAVELLKKSETYNIYKAILNDIKKYSEGKLGQDVVHDFTALYNEVCHTKLSSNKVFKKLEHLASESIKKFDQIIGQACLEALVPQGIIMEDSTVMMNIIKRYLFNRDDKPIHIDY